MRRRFTCRPYSAPELAQTLLLIILGEAEKDNIDSRLASGGYRSVENRQRYARLRNRSGGKAPPGQGGIAVRGNVICSSAINALPFADAYGETIRSEPH
jgi:hypothetical protein